MTELRYIPKERFLFYQDPDGFYSPNLEIIPAPQSLAQYITTVDPEQRWTSQPVFVETEDGFFLLTSENGRFRIEYLRGRINSQIIWVSKILLPWIQTVPFDDRLYQQLESSIGLSLSQVRNPIPEEFQTIAIGADPTLGGYPYYIINGGYYYDSQTLEKVRPRNLESVVPLPRDFTTQGMYLITDRYKIPIDSDNLPHDTSIPQSIEPIIIPNFLHIRPDSERLPRMNLPHFDHATEVMINIAIILKRRMMDLWTPSSIYLEFHHGSPYYRVDNRYLYDAKSLRQVVPFNRTLEEHVPIDEIENPIYYLTLETGDHISITGTRNNIQVLYPGSTSSKITKIERLKVPTLGGLRTLDQLPELELEADPELEEVLRPGRSLRELTQTWENSYISLLRQLYSLS